MVKAFFISDLHLGAEDGADEIRKRELVHRFLQMVRQEATHLFLVGDFFDFWFEYRTVIPKTHFHILNDLAEVRRAGVTIHYLAGNHDFALGQFFERELHIHTWPDEMTIELAGKKFYLFHGDGLAKKDGGYRLLKRILRSRLNQKFFRLLHPDFGIKLAHLASGSSRKYTNQQNDQRDESDYVEFAKKQFEAGFDYVLMGHRHNPLVYEKDGHKYINLGDWISKYSYAEFDGRELELKYFTQDNPHQ